MRAHILDTFFVLEEPDIFFVYTARSVVQEPRAMVTGAYLLAPSRLLPLGFTPPVEVHTGWYFASPAAPLGASTAPAPDPMARARPLPTDLRRSGPA